ncbi:enoyl-CoA-hydratase DpgB [Acrocarpospora phusangensis]|uniref:enoyl-CoA-hydratase DpgB n=1 Tax=Acrocarpospora phusangensis TaxID=1070424 RepID=UPI001EF17B38|nr:enoyl-CoA-hydratase DpgB [Acrocarpospora phusangensis]
MRIGSSEGLSGKLLDDLDQAARLADEGHGVILDLHPAGEGTWPGRTDVYEVSRWERTLRRLERASMPLIAVAAETCSGPAAEVLLVTDYRIGTPDFRFQAVTGRASWPGVALHRLACQLGVARARRLVLWPTSLPAGQAVDWGLLDEVAPDRDAALRRANELLAGMTAADGDDLALRRRLLLDAPALSVDDALGAHLAACDRVLRRAGVPVGVGDLS